MTTAALDDRTILFLLFLGNLMAVGILQFAGALGSIQTHPSASWQR